MSFCFSPSQLILLECMWCQILLRGVEELRHGGRSSQPPPPPQASATQRRPPNEGVGSPTKLRPILQQATKKNEVRSQKIGKRA